SIALGEEELPHDDGAAARAFPETERAMMDRDAYRRDPQLAQARADDGSVPEIDRQIRSWLKDAASLIHEG
ncbi:MAG: hypothetical protein JWQ44_2868, partial [Chthoniobacter sp.]|nr:hypothetical protein [Chthoniobacter sp.]